MKIFGIQLMVAILPAAKPACFGHYSVWNEAYLDHEMLLN
jgi:hypothetical protein